MADAPERALAVAAASLRWEDLSPDVIDAARRLFVDWMGSALAGSMSVQPRLMTRALEAAGLATEGGGGRDAWRSTVLPTRSQASTLVAALLNGASSHVQEMDDLHNRSIYHPGTCVFPAALAVAEAHSVPPFDFLTAVVAGYEVSLRVGEALGSQHYLYFHTTGTAGTFGAAVAAGHLLKLRAEALLSCLGNAGTQAAGLWQFLSDGTMSKQLHPGKAAFNGVLSAYLAQQGFTGSRQILLGKRGLLPATAQSEAHSRRDRDILREQQRDRLLEGVQETDDEHYRFTTFKIPEVSIKYHASCRHTHPAVDALLLCMKEHGLTASEITAIDAHVNSAAFQLLKDVAPTTAWAAKFNIPFCLAQAALHGRLTVERFSEEALSDPRVHDLMEKVTLRLDRSLDAGYPRYWASSVYVLQTEGVRHSARVETPKGDPEDPLSPPELREKFIDLAGPILGAEGADHLLRELNAVLEIEHMEDLLSKVRQVDL